MFELSRYSESKTSGMKVITYILLALVLFIALMVFCAALYLS